MRGLGLVAYGSEGVGKTSWAAQFTQLGKVRFLSVRESGLEDLLDAGIAPDGIEHYYPEDWEDLDRLTRSTPEGTLVVDSLSGVQPVLFDHVCRTAYKGEWDGKDGFMSYWKGPRVDSPVFLNKYFEGLDMLRNKGINVVLLGHMATEETPNTMGADYLTHTLDMDKAVRAATLKWAQAVLFLSLDLNINRSVESVKDTVMLGKAKDTANRVIWTEKSPGHVAKNRMNLKPVIPLGTSPEEGFKNFYKALPETYRRSFPLKG